LKPAEIEALFRKQFDVRLEPAMCAYVCRRLKAGQSLPDTIAVMGVNARTGVPTRYFAPTVPLNGAKLNS
jgi:hypothetical protein